jgi:hypothetical protein
MSGAASASAALLVLAGGGLGKLDQRINGIFSLVSVPVLSLAQQHATARSPESENADQQAGQVLQSELHSGNARGHAYAVDQFDRRLAQIPAQPVEVARLP